LEAVHQRQVRVAEEERALKELAEFKAEKGLAEQERHKALLRAQGIDPEST
jgi:hypothetical protein